ncbi:Uncharacterised protein [Mycobacterium tuberculosis]|nr:Uncharacterised protein [Mycobacterium tuberculosis]
MCRTILSADAGYSGTNGKDVLRVEAPLFEAQLQGQGQWP